ncbi:MAG: hypothetical protein GF315_03215, partial [candidate division Zixibacteria bacterium]|nr:hypothetical protein [candidate division Zixibacteria bacterium]
MNLSKTLLFAVLFALTTTSAVAFEPLFEARIDYETGDSPRSVCSVDLNGDGDYDLAVANASSDNVSILINNGDGTFAEDVTYGVGDEPYSVYSSDLDGDGDYDLAVANSDDNNVS